MKENNFVWQITYTDSYTGERKKYMNIGFESRGLAEMELARINRQIEKFKGLGIYLKRPNDFQLTSICQTGINFRIKKTKIRRI